MTAKFQELVAKLKEIFQLDKPELDFGIYRIMHTREKEITDFLENRLAEKVKAALAGNSAAEKVAYEKDLAEKIAQAKSLNMDPDAVPAVKELREKISALVNDEDAEAAVYAHLLAFFSRYYDSGDFMSKRRYKDGVYAIPYSGEEVKLYWANDDQYFIKTGENFSNYDFKLIDGNKVHFSLVTAETAKDNIKDNDAVRCFALWDPAKKENIEDEELAAGLPDKTIIEKNGELYIYFQYLKFKKGTKQADLTREAYEKIIAELKKQQLLTKYNLTALAPTEKDKHRTILAKHFTIYTTKITSDYFIHKDLKKFLTRELDFYIKNEMMQLDDIQSAVTINDIEKNLRQIQIVRTIADDLIAFMSQLEEFQKKLWLKKKFVVDCDWCITIDRVKEFLWPEIIANKKQIDEWIVMYAIDEAEGWTNPPSLDFLCKNKNLIIDTRHFGCNFKSKLLENTDRLDEQTNGTLLFSENFQAINLLYEKYASQIQQIYIDPPFNLEHNGDYFYKTNYKDSTWLSLLENRIKIAKHLLKKEGFFTIRCDINGNSLVRQLCNNIFGKDLFQAELLVQRIRKNVTGQGKISLPLANDSLFVYMNSEESVYANPYKTLQEKRGDYWRRIDDSAGYRNPPNRLIFGKEFAPYKHDAHFKFSQGTIDAMIKERRIRLICKNCKHEHYDGDYLGCPVCGSQNCTPQYKVLASDAMVLDTNWLDLPGYSSNWGFSTENALPLIKRTIDLGCKKDALVMDFFAGSGTTGHAVISLNRQDQQNGENADRKYILVEMGEHFETILKPRLKKVIYSPEWKDSKPKTRNQGISHCFKYITLESYEDALNNIELESKGELLEGASKDEYLLSYMLDIESKGSIINTDDFKHPFDYSLKIAIDSSGASEKRKVDLVETFNYLIGLRVAQYVRQIDKGYCFLDGTLPSGEKTFVLWRDCEKINDDELNKLLAKFGIKPGATEYDVIYVNGDHAVANVKLGEEEEGKKLKVRQIENEFLEKMFGETK